MKSTLPIRSTIFWFAIGVMVFFTMAASSPQCARSDTVVNPVLDSQAAGGNDCVHACQDAFKASFRAAQADFREAKELCNGDVSCKEEADYIYQMVKAEIVADKDDCIYACDHDQGIATGGQ